MSATPRGAVGLEEHRGTSSARQPPLSKLAVKRTPPPRCSICSAHIHGCLAVVSSAWPLKSSTRAHRRCVLTARRSELGAKAATLLDLSRRPEVTAAAAPPLEDAAMSPAACFARYGYALVRADDAARRLATDVLRVPLAGYKPTKIAGGVQQRDLADLLGPELKARWHARVRQVAALIGLSPAELDALTIQAEKHLQAAPHKGLQALHLDRDDVASRTRRVYIIIMYCSFGARSTALPLFPRADFVLPEYDDASEVTNAAELRATIAAGHWSEAAYHDTDVYPGDVAIFSQAVPHRGTRNPCASAPRICLFSLLTPFDGAAQDDHQVFEWMMYITSYGAESREAAESVYRNREHGPLERIPLDTADGREAHGAWVQNLMRWNYITSYNAASGAYAWRAPPRSRR